MSEVSSTISTEEEQSMSVKSLLICGSSNDVEDVEKEENYTEWSIWIGPILYSLKSYILHFNRIGTKIEDTILWY